MILLCIIIHIRLMTTMMMMIDSNLIFVYYNVRCFHFEAKKKKKETKRIHKKPQKTSSLIPIIFVFFLRFRYHQFISSSFFFVCLFGVKKNCV